MKRILPILALAQGLLALNADDLQSKLLKYEYGPSPRPKHLIKFPGTGADTTLDPVIGVLAQTLEPEMKADPRFADYDYYIMASFVKFLQAAGARIVPLLPSMSDATLDVVLPKLNGVFWPGGDGDYEVIARKILQKVINLNDQGTYLPLWGTCMGFEQIANFTAKNGDPNEKMYLTHESLPLKFIADPRDSQMFG